MLKHYFAIGWRSLRRNALYSAINIVGLSIGVAATLLIFLFVQHELTYDSFHEKADDIHLVIREPKPDMEHFQLNMGKTPYVPSPLGPAVEAELPGVAAAVRVRSIPAEYTNIVVEKQFFSDAIVYADPSFPEVFSFPVRQGDRSTALVDPTSAVLSEKVAEKYFGTVDAIGRRIAVLRNDGTEQVYTVSAVLGEYPTNSTLQPEVLLPFLPTVAPNPGAWFNFNLQTYVLLHPSAVVGNIEAEMSALMDRHRTEASLAKGNTSTDNPFLLSLQPLRAVHLDPHTGDSLRAYSYILSGIALAVLLLACINFITLSTARSLTRAREIGVRQVFGAVRRQLTGQLLTESFLLCGVATVLGLVLAELGLPMFNSLTGKELALHPLDNGMLAVVAMGLLLVLTLAAGSVPAVILVRLRPAVILRQQARLAKNGPVMRGLVVAQYALAITLLICLWGMAQQQAYLRDKPLGFNDDQTIVVENHARAETGDAILERLRQETSGDRRITAIAASSPSFARGWNKNEWEWDGRRIAALVMRVDPEFVPMMQLSLVAGRNFSEAQSSDRCNGVIVNEAFVEAAGLDDPVGTTVTGFSIWQCEEPPQIIGVVRDFHVLSLHREIEPTIIYWGAESEYTAFLVSVDGTDLPGAIAGIEQAWGEASGGARFEYRFLDDDLAAQYRSEQRWLKIITAASVIAVIIASLGLFGLAGVSAVRRMKEMGIRRVLGASVPQLLGTLNREFLILIALANVVAWPVAAFILSRWLRQFAYRTEIGLEAFAVTSLAAVLLAAVVVSAHTLRAASANPASVLRNE